MTKRIIFRLSLLIFGSLSFSIQLLSQEPENSTKACKGLPKEERLHALGLELGMCMWEVENIVFENGKRLTESKVFSGDEYTPKNLSTYETSFFGAIPSMKDRLLRDPIMNLEFRNEILYKISATLWYGSWEAARDSIKAMESFLSNKYGKPQKSTVSKFLGDYYRTGDIEWINNINTIEFSFYSELGFFTLTYQNKSLSNLVDQEKKDYRIKIQAEEQEKVYLLCIHDPTEKHLVNQRAD